MLDNCLIGVKSIATGVAECQLPDDFLMWQLDTEHEAVSSISIKDYHF